jgi:uncharacterized OB-fold protein
MEHATVKKLVEGHARFCRGCGHDLPGLTGCKCPRCGRVSHPSEGRRRTGAGAAGKWVVATVLLAGVILAIVAVKFRRPPARRAPRPPGVEQVHRPAGATLPVTRPALAPRND